MLFVVLLIDAFDCYVGVDIFTFFSIYVVSDGGFLVMWCCVVLDG